MSWENIQLGSVIDFSNGFAFKSAFFTDNKSDIPLVKGENLGKGEVLWEMSKYWKNDNMTNGIEKFFLNANDIILAMDRPYVGGGLKFAMIKEDSPRALQVQRIGRLVAKETRITPLFLKCIIGSFDFLNYIKNIQGGVGVPHISPAQIKGFEFDLPPLPTQKRIASILSAYDDSIENNLKRIKLLEETAQNIYKEWFVHFRFPNYEHTAFDAESGLPVGWDKKSLNNFNCIFQFKEKVRPFTDEKEYLATANIDGINIYERGEYFTFYNKPSRAQYLAPQESVWFAKMSKTYKVILFTKSSNNDILLSSGFVGFVPISSDFLPFLFCLINNKLFFDTKDLFCTGSTQVSLNNESISKLIFIEPNLEIITEFGNIVYPLIEQINKLFELNQKLKEARDILLPRLMNRTIEV